MIMFAVQQRADAIHRHWRRPRYVAKKPALDELMKAPKIINEEMSCCRPGEML